MDDIQKWIIGAIIAVVIIYTWIQFQPKHEHPVENPVSVEELSPPRVSIPNIPIHKEKSLGYHRSHERLTSMAGVPEKFEQSVEPPLRRSSPIKGSRRYSDAGRQFTSETGFITVI